MRTNRALEKLRTVLARRGLVSTSSALALALVQPALAATPPGLAASITTVSLSAAVATGSTAGLATGAFAGATAMTILKIAAPAAVVVLLSVGVALYQRPAPATRVIS